MTEDLLTPPHDDDAERALLGVVLSSPKALAEVTGRVKAEHFYSPRHASVFAAVMKVSGKGDPVDAVTVLAELERQSPNSRATASMLLAELLDKAPIGRQAGWYANRITERAGLRRLVEAGQRITHMAMSPDAGPETAERARQILDAAVAKTVSGGEDIVMAADLVTEGLLRYQSPDDSAITTGLYDLDDIFSGGLRPGGLYVVAARPGVGKSLLACVIAANIATADRGVFFASLEMTRAELFDRIVARLGDVELSHLTKRRFVHDDWDRVIGATGQIERWPLGVLDAPNIGLTTIRSKARDMTRRPNGLALIAVDYLQLIQPADPRQPREQQVAGFSRGLKLLAKELSVPVLALAQLNRGSEQRADKRPSMSDLRESGAIEADADAVLLLHDDPELPGEITAIVAKNRHGRRGQVSLLWQPHYAKAESLDPNSPADEGVA